jgi:hypothetical protein
MTAEAAAELPIGALVWWRRPSKNRIAATVLETGDRVRIRIVYGDRTEATRAVPPGELEPRETP